jgi:hypothetical protein
MQDPPRCAECAQPFGLCGHTENVRLEDVEALPVTPAQKHKVQRILADQVETEEEIATRLLNVIEELALGVSPPRNIAYAAHFEGPDKAPKVVALHPDKVTGVFDAIVARFKEGRRFPIYNALRAENNRIWGAYHALAEMGGWFTKVKNQLWSERKRPKHDDKGEIPEKERLRLAQEEGRREMLQQCMAAWELYKGEAPAYLPSKMCTGYFGFQIGRYYKHASGELMHIVGVVKTTLYGECLVAESSWGCDLKPVSMERWANEGWQEVDKSDWMACFTP